MSTAKILRELGYNTVSDGFFGYIDVWESWYKGSVDKFHSYEIYNSGDIMKCHRYSLGMAKKLAEDIANLLMNEKVKITVEGEKEQEFVSRVFAANNFEVKINEMQEKKAATGTAAYILRVIGATVAESGKILKPADGIAIDYVTAKHIYPLSWANGIITECAFDSLRTIDGEKYLYLQIHKKAEDGTYDIENRLYFYDSGEGLELSEVKGFENMPSVIHTGSDKPQFVIDRLNIANNIDESVPLGIAVYANAIDILKGVDIAFDSYVNEFVLGKKRIMVKPGAAVFENGTPVFDANDLTFYVLPEDMGDGDFIKEIDMTLRTAEHNTGIQDQLNLLSSKCGFGENHYRFDSGSISTATQIISENSTLFRTIRKHEIILNDILTELCRIILRLGNSSMAMSLDEDVEISIDFDDSIIEDKQSDFNRDLQLLSAGILNDYEFRAKWLNEDIETAKAALPGAEALTDEPQYEIE